MGKAERIRRMNSRERIAAQQAAIRRAEARRRMFIASGSVLGVLAIVVALIVAKNLGPSAPASASAAAGAAETSSVTSQITSVPAATLNMIGKGQASPLKATSGQPILTAGGKPQIVYMGAEYCPYCAAERWAMAVALSRFGTFSSLKYIHSSSTDAYPNTPTLTFHGSSYASNYITFTPVEMYGRVASGNAYPTLEKPTAAEAGLMARFDAPPYVKVGDQGSFPFVDIGNQYLVVGSQFLPSTLANLSWAKVAAAIRNPTSPIALQVDGAANSITAAICKITKNAPAAVCNSAAAKAGAGSL